MWSAAFLLAISFLLVFEGIGPLFFPKRWSRWMRLLSAQKIEKIRQIGMISISCALVLLWLTFRGFS